VISYSYLVFIASPTIMRIIPVVLAIVLLTAATDRLERALDETIAEGKDVTYDLKQQRNDPTAKSTSEVADALIQKLRGGE